PAQRRRTPSSCETSRPWRTTNGHPAGCSKPSWRRAGVQHTIRGKNRMETEMDGRKIGDCIPNVTIVTESPKLSTADLDLTALPARLDEETLEAVRSIANSPLPPLPPCDNQYFSQCLRMMLAVLPRRQADDIAGELFVAAYEQALGR